MMILHKSIIKNRVDLTEVLHIMIIILQLLSIIKTHRYN